MKFFQLFFDVGGGRRISDVGVDLAPGGDADAHRLEIRVMHIGRDDHASASDFGPDQLGRQILAPGDECHFFRDNSSSGIVHLRADRIVFPFRYPFSSQGEIGLYLYGHCIQRQRFRRVTEATNTKSTPTYY